MKNFSVRAITGIIFVVAVVASFLRPEAMVLLFAIVTGLTVWEFTGLVNARPGVTVNRFICTVAGVYFFFSMTYYCSDKIGGVHPLSGDDTLSAGGRVVSQTGRSHQRLGIHHALTAVYRPPLLIAERIGVQCVT